MPLQLRALFDALRPIPEFVVDGWAWVYHTAATIRQGAKAETDAKVLNAKLWPNWTGPYKALTAGPSSSADTSDASPLGAKLLHSGLPPDIPGADASQRVSVQRRKPCANLHNRVDML